MKRNRHEQPPPPGETLEVRIEGLLHSGEAWGRDASGRTVHVANAVPGDRVRVRIVSERRSHLEAVLETVLEPGPDRVEAPCPHAASCGGCDFQYLSAEAQSREKQALLRRAFEQHGLASHLPPLTFVSSPLTGYRNRIRLGLVRAGGRPLLGFRRRHSREIEEIGSCAVATPAVNRLLAEVRERHLVEPRPGELVLLSGERGTDDVAAVVEDRKTGASWIRRPGTPVRFTTASGLEIGVSPLAFSQANFGIARQMSARIDSLVESRKDRVVELYAGIGTFTVGLARRAQWVDAVELDAAALAQLKDNLQVLDLQNVKVFPAAVTAAGLAKVAPCGLLVLDPPWDGCPELPAIVEKLSPRRIGYVSCHPAALARDIRPLLESGRYRLAGLELYDQFPMTAHIESIAVLEKTA